MTRSTWHGFLLVVLVVFVCLPFARAQEKKQGDASASPTAGAFDFRTKAGGKWSDAGTWREGKAPTDGSRVLIGAGHRVEYDMDAATPIRELHVSGTLSFARDRSTKLVVGLLRVGSVDGDRAPTGVEDIDKHDHAKPAAGHGNAHGHGDAHGQANASDPSSGPALEVGTPGEPIATPHVARIVLKHFEGMDKEKLPAIVCRPGARMDFHGTLVSRGWVELGADVKAGDKSVTLAEAVTGWRAGDEILVTGSTRKEGRRGKGEYARITPTSARRTATKIEGNTLHLGEALTEQYQGSGKFRAEVANLTRNVIVESAEPDGVRGHTMYHYGSLGSISYARFAHLGKEGGLGRYPIHFHRIEDSMRGSSVIGAVVSDSHNRWVTVHGAQYLVVRDCVGVGSIGHGYFLEDGSEVYNVLDRNLGVQANRGRSMKGQALPFDPNEGAAFWWANGRNTIVRNVACENHEYGYRFDSQKSSQFSGMMDIRQPDGSYSRVDIRAIPHYRFQHNESHTEGLYSFVFAGPGAASPDTKHPHIIRDLTIWNTHYSLRTETPTMLVENVHIHGAAYGIYRPRFENHVYRNLRIEKVGAEPFNRGQDDDSEQHGRITVDGLVFASLTYGGAGMPLIQMSDNNLSGSAESHFRNVRVIGEYSDKRWPLVNRGGGSVVRATTEKGVPVYLHDWYGEGKTAKVVCTSAKDLPADRAGYKTDPNITGRESLVTEVSAVEFPQLLDPIDDQPPATIITSPARGHVARILDGKLTIRGTTTDDTVTKRVVVNGVEAKDVDFNFHQWEVTLTNVKPGQITIEALAEDRAGNKEQTPHRIVVTAR